MRTVLSNGLTVIVEEVHAAPVVALQAWVKVGSADETEKEAGLAHLHEHMLFKGTSRRGPGEIARDVESRGGEINAWTSFDQTVYHLVMASSFFEDGLDILTDAVLRSGFDAGELSREIEVVLEEIKRSHDIPARRASRELFDLAYASHPYRRPVIGHEHTVRSFTRDDVLSFYRRHYTPDDVALVVVGDVDAARALSSIERQWGQAQGRAGERARRAPEPRQEAPRVRVLKEPVQETHLSFAWHAPGVMDADLAALDLLATILGQGDSARLPHHVKLERHLVNNVYAYAYTPQDPGLLIVGATLQHGEVPEATREILREVYRLRREGPDERELETAKHMLESEAIWQRETVQGMARKLGFYETVTGSLDFERRYYERVRGTTAEEVRAVCERWVRGAGLNVVALAPMEAGFDAQHVLSIAAEIDAETHARPRAAVPAPAKTEAPPSRSPTRRASRKADASGIYREVLPSGARVLVKPEPAVPLVAVRAVWNGGLRHEDDRSAGIHQLLSSLLNKGTERRSAREVALESDRLAANIAGNAGRNSFGLRGDFLARHFEPSMRLFAECLREPAFDPREVEREKAHQIQEIRSREDSPSSAVFELFARTLFTRHPYRLDVLGTEAVVAGFTPGDLASWFRQRYGPHDLVLSVVGDVDPEQAFELCGELLSGGAPGPRHTAPEVPLEPPVDAARTAVLRMEKQQAHLVLGFLGARVTDRERFPLDVLSSVLAGQGGRLFTELRDKRSMAYSITAFNLEGVDPGYFAVYMGTSPEKLEAAVEGIRAELRRVREEPISAPELARARRYLVGTHAIGLQKNAARAAVIAFDEAYGVGADAYTRYEAAIEAVDAAAVQEAAQRTIDLERAVLAVVTPKP